MNHPKIFDKNGNELVHGLCIRKGNDKEGVYIKNNPPIDVWEEIVKTRNLNYVLDPEGVVHVDQTATNAIWRYISEPDFAELSLYEYLDKIFSGDADGHPHQDPG